MIAALGRSVLHTIETCHAGQGMSRPLILVAALGLFSAASFVRPSHAQDEQPLQPRVLAPGVLTVVEPDVKPAETFSEYRKLPDLETTPFTPNEAPATETLHSRAQRVIFRHDVWCYEFSFKPLRTIRLEVPQPTGKMQEKLIWYMVYRVRNLGEAATLGDALVATEENVNMFEVEPKADPEDTALAGRFFPSFVLEGWSATSVEGNYDRKAYLDRIIPNVIPKIQEQEDPATTFHSSVDISTINIPAGDEDSAEGVWGVAVWEDIDPRIDYLSVYVQGLTNAYRIKYLADGKREYELKTLQINFWRPGDTLNEDRDEIRLGIPLVDSMREQALITFHYGLPGPVIQAEKYSPETGKTVRLFELDGVTGLKQLDGTPEQVYLNEDLDSRLLIQMQEGEMPKVVRDEFAKYGVDVPENVALSEDIRNRLWSFEVDEDGETSIYRLHFTPRYWEKVGRQFRYLDRLEYMWIYR